MREDTPIFTVSLMGQNNIGAVSVPALKTALPRSADFSFIADGRLKAKAMGLPEASRAMIFDCDKSR